MHYPYLKRSQPAGYKLFCTVGEQPAAAVDGESVAAVTTRSKVPCVLKLELSTLRLPTLHSGSSPAFHVSARGCSIFGKHLNAYLKFTVYDRKHGRIHTHLRNAVRLVWGSLRLAPIKANEQ